MDFWVLSETSIGGCRQWGFQQGGQGGRFGGSGQGPIAGTKAPSRCGGLPELNSSSHGGSHSFQVQATSQWGSRFPMGPVEDTHLMDLVWAFRAQRHLRRAGTTLIAIAALQTNSSLKMTKKLGTARFVRSVRFILSGLLLLGLFLTGIAGPEVFHGRVGPGASVMPLPTKLPADGRRPAPDLPH